MAQRDSHANADQGRQLHHWHQQPLASQYPSATTNNSTVSLHFRMFSCLWCKKTKHKKTRKGGITCLHVPFIKGKVFIIYPAPALHTNEDLTNGDPYKWGSSQMHWDVPSRIFSLCYHPVYCGSKVIVFCSSPFSQCDTKCFCPNSAFHFCS